MRWLPIFLLCFLAIQTVVVNGCLQVERDALLEFKAGVNDPFHRLASWRREDCCTWAGVECSNRSGHVVKLNLGNPFSDWNNGSLSGEINPSLHALTDLEYLNLSYNNFRGSLFPKFVCSFRKLIYLDLSMMGLSGTIPSQISNLSKLQYLNLFSTEYFSPDTYITYAWWSPNYAADIWWFSHLRSLKYLDISGVNLQNSGQWVQALDMLPSLETLILDGNNLTTIPTSLSIVNFSSLTTFYLANQNFNTFIPDWIGQLTGLTEVVLRNCSFVGPIPSFFGSLISLRILVLVGNNKVGNSHNYLDGPMPSLHNLHNLTHLHLQNINIYEEINDLVSKLSDQALKKLEYLNLGNNHLIGNLSGYLNKMPNLSALELRDHNIGVMPVEFGNSSNLIMIWLECFYIGEVSEVHLSRLTKLKTMFLDSSFITVTVSSNWVPSFQLETLGIRNCELGPKFPSWLRNQTQLSTLEFSNTKIVGNLPDWFWNLSSLSYIDFSHNQITGRLPLTLDPFYQLQTFILKNNEFSGEIFSSLPQSLQNLDLSYNSFSGPLPLKFEGPSLSTLILSNNLFNGSIGHSVCGLRRLQILNLSGNNIYGNLPHCWPKMLQILNIANNQLFGTIPSSMGLLNMLVLLQLNNNNLTGELPSSLRYCENLYLLDLGENQFHGKIPEWIGENLSNITELRLRSNSFSGTIPPNIMHLRNLQVLDLGDNNITGSIPQNLDNLVAMASINQNIVTNASYIYYFLVTWIQFYSVSMSVVINSLNLEYTTLPLSSLKSVDLSENNLIGEIPENITTLNGLTNLNLSNNHLSGTIPKEIGKMQSMESLDLGTNNLSGLIPDSLATLHFLTSLNLSYNNLSGKIPTGNQLQTFNDPYSYIGNIYLCGLPLNKSCDSETTVEVHRTRMLDELDEIFLYLSVVLGFVFGFWVLLGVLMFKRNWRYRFFLMVDNMFDRVYVFVMIYVARLRRNAAR